MADKQYFSPERDLLKVIEAGAAAKSSLFKLKRQGVSFFAPGALAGRISFFKAYFKKGMKISALNLNGLNKALLVILIILGVYVVGDMTIAYLGINRRLAEVFSFSKLTATLSDNENVKLKAAAYYLDKAAKRNLFTLTAKILTPDNSSNVSAGSPIALRAAALKLVGISWSDSPDAIIEDSNMKKTFFVKSQDAINEFKVEEILRDKIILSYQNERFELK
jgi:hypothetical protein